MNGTIVRSLLSAYPPGLLFRVSPSLQLLFPPAITAALLSIVASFPLAAADAAVLSRRHLPAAYIRQRRPLRWPDPPPIRPSEARSGDGPRSCLLTCLFLHSLFLAPASSPRSLISHCRRHTVPPQPPIRSRWLLVPRCRLTSQLSSCLARSVSVRPCPLQPAAPPPLRRAFMLFLLLLGVLPQRKTFFANSHQLASATSRASRYS